MEHMIWSWSPLSEPPGGLLRLTAPSSHRARGLGSIIFEGYLGCIELLSVPNTCLAPENQGDPSNGELFAFLSQDPYQGTIVLATVKVADATFTRQKP